MAIVKMSQFSLLVFQNQRDELLKHLQNFSYVHFKDLKNAPPVEGTQEVPYDERLTELERQMAHLDWMMKLLKDYDTRPKGLKGMKYGVADLSLKELYEKHDASQFDKDYYTLRNIQENADSLQSTIVEKKTKLESLRPWKNLTVLPEELNHLKETIALTGMVQRKYVDRLKEALDEIELAYYEVVKEEGANFYLLLIAHKEVEEEVLDVLRRNGFNAQQVDSESLVKDEIHSLEEHIKDLEAQRESELSKIPPFGAKVEEYEIVYEALGNKMVKLGAPRNFLSTERLDWMQGYVPTQMVSELDSVLQEYLGDDYILELEEVDKDSSEIPILLKNKGFSKLFESVTNMYALPRYNEIDPTPFLAPFYWVFFGMMAADIGYGLLGVIACLVALKAFHLKDSMKLFVKFFLAVSVSAIIWGAIYGSFFGGIIPLPALIDPSKDFMFLLILSVGMGLIHLFFGLGIKAYMLIRDGKPLDAIFDVLFWYMSVLGAIGFLGSGMITGLPPIVKTISMWVMVFGMIGIVLFAGRESKNPALRLVGGLYELYGISSWVGDLVSYSRLMALGLAGGFIGVAVNMIAKMLFGSGIPGMIGGVIVFIVFHLFNVFLSYLGAYVHTLRLTYVEFFGKFYEGGGKPFERFRKEPKYINLKDK